ncbi:MAG: ribonuclease VapC [Candidatus Pacearchaeota archaeon]|nr:MAG: ribonuclease VapC [Candidatus Pacearchaeota archaeon]
MLIIPDTNFLIYLSKYKLWHNLEKEYGRYKLIVLPELVYELDKLSKRGKDKESALLALELTSRITRIRKRKGYGDKAILKIASMLKKNKKRFIIATMDKDLIKKLKKQNMKILTIRQKKYLREI